MIFFFNYYHSFFYISNCISGPDSVVLVDIFPDGNMTLVPHNNNFSKRILCIADTTFIPARVWAKILDNSHHNKVSESRIIFKSLEIIITSLFTYSLF